MSTSHEYPSGENLIRELEKIRLQMMDLKQELADEKAKFSALIEPWTQAFWEASSEGMTVSDSESWRAFTGQTLDELMKPDGWMGAVHPDDREYAGALWHDSVENAKVFDAVFRLREQDGAYRWTNVRAAPLRNPDGSIKKWVGLNVDIHDRKAAEESLRKSETKIRSIFEAAPIGIGVLTDRVIREVNKQLCVITGYTKDELLQQDTRKLYPEDDDYEYAGRVKYQQIFEQGTGTVETRFKRKDGRIINVLLKSTLLNANDISAGVTFTVLDITERKQAEKALRQSKENYEELVQNANSAILRWKKDGTISIFNEYAQRLFGYKAEEIIGKNVAILLPQKDSSGKDLTGLIQDITSHPERYINNVNENISRDGRRILMAWTNKAVHDQHGRVKELMAIGTDITELKRSEDALRQSEIKFRTVFEQSAIGMGRVCFDDARWIDVNDAFCSMIGYTREELLGMPWPEITHPDDLDLDLVQFRRMAAGELNSYTVEKRFIHKQGHPVWARLALSLVRDPQGQPDYEIAVIEDISDRKKAEKELMQLTETLEKEVAERTREAEQRAEALRQLALELSGAEDLERRRIAMVLHDDLQQYLAAIRFRLGDLISNEPGDSKINQRIAAIESLVDESIQKCRNLSHELSPPVLHQNGLIAALGWLTQETEKKYGLRVDLHAQPDAEPASPRLAAILFRSIRELLFNIVKHADADRAEIRIKFHDGQIHIQVNDPGKGFDMERIRSYQTGTGGFGLFAVEERIRFLGGAFTINTGPGEGTRIDISVPNRSARPVKIDELLPDIDEMRGEEYGLTAREHNGRIRILLADDHVVMREGLAGILQNQPDLEVVAQAENGLEAVQMTDRTVPDVILMDITMPEMDGIAATERISKKHPGIRIIGLSMHDDPSIKDRMIRAGACDYIYKASPSGELLQTIRAAVS
jgi:PAS domain S-box-containing protein